MALLANPHVPQDKGRGTLCAQFIHSMLSRAINKNNRPSTFAYAASFPLPRLLMLKESQGNSTSVPTDTLCGYATTVIIAPTPQEALYPVQGNNACKAFPHADEGLTHSGRRRAQRTEEGENCACPRRFRCLNTKGREVWQKGGALREHPLPQGSPCTAGGAVSYR